MDVNKLILKTIVEMMKAEKLCGLTRAELLERIDSYKDWLVEQEYITEAGFISLFEQVYIMMVEAD